MLNLNRPTKRATALLPSVAHHATSVLCAVVIAIGALSTAQGAVLVNNGTPNTTSGDQMSVFRVAENFMLGAASNITSINFWTLLNTPADYSGSISWIIYNDAAGTPGGVVASGSTAAAAVATGVNDVIGTLDQYAIGLTGLAVSLGAGNYFLGLQDATPGSDINPPDMLWAGTSGGVAPVGQYLDPDFGWTATDVEHAFQISGDGVGVPPPPPGVPEPTTLALLGIGLAVAGFSRSKK